MDLEISPLAPKSFPQMPFVNGVRMATANTETKYKGRPTVFIAKSIKECREIFNGCWGDETSVNIKLWEKTKTNISTSQHYHCTTDSRKLIFYAFYKAFLPSGPPFYLIFKVPKRHFFTFLGDLF
mgnify:CR=1 FL=1